MSCTNHRTHRNWKYQGGISMSRAQKLVKDKKLITPKTIEERQEGNPLYRYKENVSFILDIQCHL